jgi:hypothetical protein
MADPTPTPTPTPTPAPFVFDYTAYNNPGLTVQQLDALATAVFAPTGTGTFAMIFGSIKLAVAIAYIFCRSKMIDEQLQIQKQQYENAQDDNNQNEVNNQNPPGT